MEKEKLIKKITFFILIIWQFPQILGGLILRFICKVSKIEKYKNIYIYYCNNFSNFGISFGNYIFLSNDKRGKELLLHEYGHSIQSLILGLFYVPIIGIYSIIRQIYYFNKISHIKTKNEKKVMWYKYYSGFPEKWANKLANVDLKKWENI